MSLSHEAPADSSYLVPSLAPTPLSTHCILWLGPSPSFSLESGWGRSTGGLCEDRPGLLISQSVSCALHGTPHKAKTLIYTRELPEAHPVYEVSDSVV